MKKLKVIYSPISEEVKDVENILQKEIDSKDDFLSDISHYISESKGKRIRPALTLLSSCAVNPKVSKETINLAAAIELIHTATLIHDDIIDKALKRRGKETINVKWGDNFAILIGDYIYSASSRLLSSIKTPSILLYLSNITNIICVGEIKQLKMVSKKILTENEYLAIIEKKTANLMAAACKTGAVLARAKNSHVKRFEKFGRNFGMAFQIIDDCKDIIGNEKIEGKTLRTDQKEGKVTLPLIYQKDTITKEDAVQKAIRKAEDFVQKAKEELSVLKDSIFKRKLFDLSDFIVRKNYNLVKR